jgi:uncharacterized protein YfaS (alpha-2-macroglobulin family)
MASPAYDAGDVVPCSFAVNNSAGTAADPTGLTFKIRSPAGTVTTYTYGTDSQLVKDSTGRYHVDWPVPAAAASEGLWSVRFEATGTNACAGEASFRVRDSAFY